MKFHFLLSLSLFFTNGTMAQQNAEIFLQTNADGRLSLTKAGASHFSKLALACIQQEFPNKLNQTLASDGQLKLPRELHPAFYGCLDWHSAVHGHWMLVRLLKLFPEMPEATDIREKLSQNLTASNCLAELDYLRSESKSWERMYGWAWLLKLAEELHTWHDPDGRQWAANLQPLTDFFIARYFEFLPVQAYPVRTGVHPNTAFGLSFAWDFANTTGQADLKNLIEKRAKDYYLLDSGCPADYEPSGEDFLSACLEEANLMGKVLPKDLFSEWFKRFLPKKNLAHLTRPAGVSDRSDPKIVHLDGLNLSRAWCLYGICPKLSKKKEQQAVLEMAKRHLEASVPYVATQHYEGSHWLASFAVYALSVGE